MANVTPIFKQDRKDLLNNYRPISLLSVPSKILEHVVFKQVIIIYKYIIIFTKISYWLNISLDIDLMIPPQINYHIYIMNFCLDAKKDVRIVFCDISKAFDKAWHRGLLYKLRKTGIKGDFITVV